MHILTVDTLSMLDACFLLNCEFKTDVLGVYDRPPSEPNAILLREIGKDKLIIPYMYINEMKFN